MSSNLAVIIFDNESDARQVREELSRLQHQDLIHIDDAAVIYKDPSGKVKVDNELESGTKVGAVIGGLLGPLLFVLFPIPGILIGAAGGALIGKVVDPGVDKKFVKEVADALEPGNSALFVLAHDANPNAIRAALEPYHGRLYQTTLSEEAEETLRHALE